MIKIKKISDQDSGYETETYRSEIPDWAVPAVVKIAKNTVLDLSRKRQTQANYLTTLQNLIVNRPRYATVDDAVNDMRQRTGLDSYVKTLNDKRAKKIVAMIKSDAIPKQIQESSQREDILNFIENKSKSAVNLGLPLLTYELEQSFYDFDAVDPEVQAYLSSKIQENKKDKDSLPQDFGRDSTDSSLENSDTFKILEPASK